MRGISFALTLQGRPESYLNPENLLHRPARHSLPCRGQHSREINPLANVCLLPSVAGPCERLSQFLTFSKLPSSSVKWGCYQAPFVGQL